MAESIAVCFKSAKWDELKKTLDSIGLTVDRERWHFPRDAEWCVTIYPYDDLLNEYEDDAIDRLFTFWDDFPASILCIELRRSQGNRACDCATDLVILLLERFEGIVDDLLVTCWTLDDIATEVMKKGHKFLDCYRH
jgi:hypothetical protein